MTGAKFEEALGAVAREEGDALRLGATFVAVSAVAVDATSGLTLGAMRGVPSDALPDLGLGEGSPGGIGEEAATVE